MGQGSGVIIQVGRVLGHPIEEIEAEWGEAITAAEVAVGAEEELPRGGWGRTYRVHGYDLLVNYDYGGIAQGIQITKGLVDLHYTLEQWGPLLLRMGMMATKKPNQVLPMSRKWFDFQGYGIHIFAERPKGPVWSVRIFRARQRTLLEKLLGR